MRTPLFPALAAVVISAIAPLVAVAAGGTPLRLQVEKSTEDIAQHRLRLKLSHPAGKVQIKVVGESEAVLAEEEHDFTGRPAGAPLVVTWSPSNNDDPPARIEVRAYDAAGSWTGVELFPWSVTIPHEDVNFATDSAEIPERDVPKLEAAFAKMNEVLAKDKEHGHQHPGLTFFLAGHTDTVGSAEHNLKLSQDRARSIGAWFRKRGVRLPIAYEGYGETALKVRTADNVDEPRNRRADYILTNFPPPVRSSGGFKPSWKRIP
jgi:outer membrane protein OmpA-like peptidoglycan-associated protein